MIDDRLIYFSPSLKKYYCRNSSVCCDSCNNKTGLFFFLKSFATKKKMQYFFLCNSCAPSFELPNAVYSSVYPVLVNENTPEDAHIVIIRNISFQNAKEMEMTIGINGREDLSVFAPAVNLVDGVRVVDKTVLARLESIGGASIGRPLLMHEEEEKKKFLAPDEVLYYLDEIGKRVVLVGVDDKKLLGSEAKQ